jgi:antitoxin FitA
MIVNTNGDIMAAVTIRNISDETHRALRVRAAFNGRSTEAEIRAILEAAIRPSERIRLGSLLTAIAQEAGSSHPNEADPFAQLRDTAPAQPMEFE